MDRTSDLRVFYAAAILYAAAVVIDSLILLYSTITPTQLYSSTLRSSSVPRYSQSCLQPVLLLLRQMSVSPDNMRAILTVREERREADGESETDGCCQLAESDQFRRDVGGIFTPSFSFIDVFEASTELITIK